MNKKPIIYQVFTRLYGNRNITCKKWGTEDVNGSGKFNDFTTEELEHIKQLGVTHIWFTGVLRHATQTDYRQADPNIPTQHPAVVKGIAGSPYAVCDYYDVDPALAVDVKNRKEEYKALVKRCHDAGLRVIMDFVPNHVARQYKSVAKPEGVKDLGEDDNPNNGFDPQNNFYYCPGESFAPEFDLTYGTYNPWESGIRPVEPYHEEPAKSTGNDCFCNHPGRNDWYETVKLNYGKDYWTQLGHYDPIPDTWKKMTDILCYWKKEAQVDGFRCDMAEMVPTDFWSYATSIVKKKFPRTFFIGEVYDPSQYRNYLAAGFDYLYDKVGMYDTMRNAICGNGWTREITRAWISTHDIVDHMLYFLENHDEQRIASDFFAGDARKAIPGLVVSALLNKCPFMIYAGEEYGERGMDEEGFSGKDGRTTIFDYWCIDTLWRAANDKLTNDEKALYDMHRRILQIARTEKAVDGSFYDLMYANQTSDYFSHQHNFVFLRKNGKEVLLVVCNFSGEPMDVEVCVPHHAMDFMGITEKRYTATDLLTNEKAQFNLRGNGNLKMSLPAYGARIWKFVDHPKNDKK